MTAATSAAAAWTRRQTPIATVTTSSAPESVFYISHCVMLSSWRINFFNYSRVSHAWILVSRFPFSSPAFSVVPQRPMSDGYHSVRGTGRISWQTVAQRNNSRQENHVLLQLSPPIADASQCCNKQSGLFEYNYSLSSVFEWSQNPLNDLLTWFNVFCAGFGVRCLRVDKVAVFSRVHKRSIIDLL